jgi:AcrR family transcriptional regulator
MAQQLSSEDGRVARRLDNRARILDALFSLIRSGRHHPTLKEIAADAGVTARTLLNHFPDMRSLLMAAAAHGKVLAERRLPALPEHPDPEIRVREFFRSAASFFDSYAAVRWATITSPANLPGFGARAQKGAVSGMVEQRVAELLLGFGIVLEDDKERHEAVRMAIDPLSWRLLRTWQGLSRTDAAASMARCVIALARDGAAATTRERAVNGKRSA